VSVDFDLFSGESIDRELLGHVRRVFAGAPISLLVNNAAELTMLVQEVKITLLTYPFPPLDPFIIYEGLPLLSMRDIAATKAYTIGRRGSFKDYVNLYFMLSEKHMKLADIINGAEIKSGVEFNSRLFS
jgi:hypothetical protein